MIKIENNNLSAHITTYGASLAKLHLAGLDRSLILGFDTTEEFRKSRLFMGAIIGRFANRIEHGTTGIAGKTLEKNENGHTHLHGGTNGIWNKDWIVKNLSANRIELELHSLSIADGYPGNIRINATYSINECASLCLELRATSDAQTIVNICHHPYFNFGSTDTIDGHKLHIRAKNYLPNYDNLVPTGEVKSVDGSAFDFRELRTLETYKENIYNNTFCLHEEQQASLRHAATLLGPNEDNSLIEMQIWTTQPGLHFYNGYKLNTADGHQFRSRSGLCLEAQAWPNSPNEPNFPSVVLKENDIYYQRTEYRFNILRD